MRKEISSKKENDEILNIDFTNNVANIEKPIKKHYRSKGILCRPITSNAECLAKSLMVDRQCSSIIMPVESSESKTTTTSKSITSTSHSEYQPSAEEISDLFEEKELEMKRAAL